MIRNDSLIYAFVEGKYAQNGSMSTNGEKLFSYRTCIAQKVGGTIVFNGTKYSVTTSKQQSYARRIFNGSAYRVYEITNVPLGTHDLERYYRKKVA